MARLTLKFSFRTILSFLTILLVGFVIYQNWPDIVDTFYHLDDANIFILLLLIPEQLLMYYACGQIFFSYFRRKPTQRESLRISTELNFVNHAIPAGSVGGLGFLTFRLRPFGVSAGQTSFLYLFRYAITTVINYLQSLIAIIVLLVLKLIPADAIWVVWVAVIMNVGVSCGILLLVYIANSTKRLQFFAKIVAKILPFLRRDQVERYFYDIHASVLQARRDKRRLLAPLFWGIIYSFLEIATYWLVAISLGRPELLPFIMVGEAIGSVFDGIVPYGLYELGMAGVMIALGVDFATATLVTVMTRVLTLLITIITGIVPYRQTIMKGNYERRA